MPALKPLPKNLVLVVITVITAICFLVALGGLAKVHCERILPQYAAMTAFRRCSEFLTRTHAGHLSGYKLAPKATASQLAADCADGGWGGNPDTNVNEGLENISFGKRRRLLGVVDELCEKWYRSSWFHLFWGLIILVVWLFLAFKGYLDDLDIRITALAALIIGCVYNTRTAEGVDDDESSGGRAAAAGFICLTMIFYVVIVITGLWPIVIEGGSSARQRPQGDGQQAKNNTSRVDVTTNNVDP